MRSDLLHVVAAVSNPIRWNSRVNLAKKFIQHMLDSGVNLTIVECQYGDRSFDFAGIPHIQHIGRRSKSLIWNKENLLNIGAAANPDAKYIAFLDADIKFRKPAWASETVHALQQYHVVQPWDACLDLGPNDDLLETHRSFCALHQAGVPMQHGAFVGGPYQFGHPGYGWAFTRDALDRLGGLIQTAALGAADHHMALALIGKVEHSVPGGIHPNYLKPLLRFQADATAHICKNIGAVPGIIEHSWHGPKVSRKYVGRWKILVDHQFDPETDMKINSHGVAELSGTKPDLRIAIDRYFRQRDEDSNSVG